MMLFEYIFRYKLNYFIILKTKNLPGSCNTLKLQLLLNIKNYFLAKIFKKQNFYLATLVRVKQRKAVLTNSFLILFLKINKTKASIKNCSRV